LKWLSLKQGRQGSHEFLGAVGADADHHQEAHPVGLQADLEVDPVDAG